MNIIPQFDIGADIGRGLGGGFSDAFSEVAKKGQLARSLDNIRKQQGATYDPLKTYTSLASTPFLDPSHIGPLSEMIRMQYRNAATRGTGTPTAGPGTSLRQPGLVSPQTYSTQGTIQPSNVAPGTSPQQISQPISSGQAEPVDASKFRRKPTPSLRTTPTEALLRPAPVIDPQWVLERTNELEPIYGREEAANRAQAEAEVPLKQWQSEQSAAKAQIEQQDELRNRIRLESASRVQALDDKGGFDSASFYNKIPSSVFSKMENRGLDQIANGANPDQVAQDIADRTLRLARASENAFGVFKEGEGFIGGASKLSNPTQWLDSLKRARSLFKDENALEEFKGLLESSQGFSPDYAASLTYPLTQDLNKVIKGFTEKKGGLLDKLIQSRSPNLEKNVSKFVDQILDNLGEYDSLQTIRLALAKQNPGIESMVMDEISRRADENPRLLNAPQREELTITQPYFPNLSDLFMDFMGVFR